MILDCSQTLYGKENKTTSVYRLKQFKTFIFLAQNRGGAWTKREKTLFTHIPSPPRIINGLLAFAFAFVYKRDQWIQLNPFPQEKKKSKRAKVATYYSKLFNTDNAVCLNQQLKFPEKSLVLLRSHWTLKNALPPDEYSELIRSATTKVISKFCRWSLFCLHASWLCDKSNNIRASKISVICRHIRKKFSELQNVGSFLV